MNVQPGHGGEPWPGFMQAYSFSADGEMIAGLQVASLDEMRLIALRFNKGLRHRWRGKAEGRWNYATIVGDARTLSQCQLTLTVKGGTSEDLYTQAA